MYIVLILRRSKFVYWALCIAVVTISNAAAAEPANSWSILFGAGSSKDGWANTYQQVQTLDVIIRHQRPQSKTRGKGRWLNRKSVLVELPLSWIYTPDNAAMAGITFNVAWHLLANPNKQPYFFIGGGPAYTQAVIPGTSSNLKGTYQLGAGLEFRSGEGSSSKRKFIELRYHHISNGGIEKPNDSINSAKLLFGFSF